MFAGFRKFLYRTNLVDLAVAVVAGVALNAVVQALIGDLITPLITAFAGHKHFNNLVVTVHDSELLYGDFLNSLLTFVVIAAVVYFLIVVPAARATALVTRNAEATLRECPECLSTIPAAAKRCRFCTAVISPPDTGAASQRPAGRKARLPGRSGPVSGWRRPRGTPDATA